MPKVISPSRLARFYFHECERYLRYSSVRAEDREREGVPRPVRETRPVAQAILDSGLAWEEEVVEHLLSGHVYLAEGAGEDGKPLSESVIDQATARRLLTSIEPGESVYQPELAVPPRFYERYGLDPDVVHWPPCRPDLVEADATPNGETVLRVIDIKASPGVKLSHRIQATVYSLVLECLLEEWGVTDRTVGSDAGIWLAQQPEPEYFDLRSLKPPIEQFLAHELQPLLERSPDEAPWHVYFRCEWCEWFEHCRTEMRKQDSVSRVPYLTTHGKRFLETSDPPVRTLSDLAELLDDPQRTKSLDGCASLRGRASRLRSQVTALREKEVKPLGAASLAMPLYENVRVVLTVQSEPVSGNVYAYGLYAQGLRDLTGEGPFTTVRVAPDGSPETVAGLRRNLVEDLWAILHALDQFNANREWKDQKALQIYVFDSYERRLLVEALMEALRDEEVAEEALKVLFYLQGEDLLRAAEHPAEEVFFPIVVLNEVLQTQLALPVEVSYRFADANQLLQPSEGGFEFQDSEYFGFELSNQMRSDAIYAVWYQEKTDRLAWIENELKARLWGANSLVNGTRQRLREAGALFAYAPKFRLPASFAYGSPLLSRLAFLAQYEAVLGCLDVRTRRMAPLGEQVQRGDAVVLEWLEDDRFRVVGISPDVELDANPFPRFLLAEDNDEGRRALLGFDDFWNRARPWVRKGLKLRIAGIRNVIGSPPREVQLQLTEGPDSPPLRRRRRYVLSPRFTDFNTHHVINELDRIDSEGGPFLDLLEDPARFALRNELPDEIASKAVSLGERHSMTRSQLRALEGVTLGALRLVWGPPGTGKTHFLALTILALLEAHRASRRPFRVVVTAFTHAAIENLLRKLCELQNETRIVEGDLGVGKLKSLAGDAGRDTDLVPHNGGDSWLDDHELAVLGGTAWALRELEIGCADLVVIDEGSQLLVPTAAIPIERLSHEGRLLIAGDDRQLPPIVLGAYPEPEEGELPFHRSIFECLRRADPDERFTSTLLENWRMNEALCEYPRRQVYVPDYRSAHERIAARRLRLAPSSRSDWVDDVLAPEYPLAVCVLDGVQATAENVVEAGLVADVTVRLRERLLVDGEPVTEDDEGDELFWRDGLFIVSPHHAQIRAIRTALDERRTWGSEPFVGTVDKMQGQECDAVIVSYGVSDVEYAVGEKEFIYSLNRLNVAITRARSKTIVFLPRPLLEPPVAAFDDDSIAEGIAFMQGLWRFAESAGERCEVRLENEAALVIHRVPFDAIDNDS